MSVKEHLRQALRELIGVKDIKLNQIAQINNEITECDEQISIIRQLMEPGWKGKEKAKPTPKDKPKKKPTKKPYKSAKGGLRMKGGSRTQMILNHMNSDESVNCNAIYNRLTKKELQGFPGLIPSKVKNKLSTTLANMVTRGLVRRTEPGVFVRN